MSIIDLITGFSSFSMINSSAAFEITGVKEIGLRPRSLLMSSTGLDFGIGITLAFFQSAGTISPWNDKFRIEEIGWARIKVYSLSSHGLISLGITGLHMYL